MPLPPEDKERLRRIHNTLEDRVLEPDDAFYVPFQAQLHSGLDPILELSTSIAWSQAASVHLLSGQRGSGKSTELRRLRKLLLSEGCDVILVDMRDYMNMTKPVEITDFLISIMAALTDALDSLDQKFLKSLFQQRIGAFIESRLKMNDAKAELSVGNSSVAQLKVGLGASLKEDTSFKGRLQEVLRGQVAQLVKHAHDFAAEVVGEIRKRTGDEARKVVLLVDSVEQLRAEGVEEAGTLYKSVENLFFGHADALHLPLLHVVYTIPPYLVPLVPSLGRVLGGGTIRTLASIRVRDREGRQDMQALGIMEHIMDKRSKDWLRVFSREQLRRMALSTGGDLRDFFRFARNSIVKAAISVNSSLPLTDEFLEDTENHLRREMLPLAEADKEWLRRINVSKRPELKEIQHLPQLARFLDTHLVLNYRNGDDWYDVHPLLWDELKQGTP